MSIIRPELVPINATIRRKLVEGVNNIKYREIVAHYIQTGETSWGELSNASPETRDEVEALIAKAESEPDPELVSQENQDWKAITNENPGSSITDLKRYIQKIDRYLDQYEQYGNSPLFHVAQAKTLKKNAQRGIEETEYNEIDWFNQKSILKFLMAFPDTDHFKEIDRALWDYVRSNMTVQSLEDFIYNVPNSEYLSQAQEALSQYQTWEEVVMCNDIFDIKNFIDNNPGSPFIDEAQKLFAQLRNEEVKRMRHNPSEYPMDRVLRVIDSGIFTLKDLRSRDLISDDSYKKLGEVVQFKRNYSFHSDDYSHDNPLPNEENTTDVFLLGVPSTGKTCVLMGLLSSARFNWNMQVAEGYYGDYLQNYCTNGILPDRTKGGFVARIHGTISDKANMQIEHHINLIEMAGEDFATKLARNPEHVVSFSEMGNNASEMLNNNHRKIFFIVIDPTTEVVKFSHEVVTYDEQGNPDINIETVQIRQSSVLKGMMDLLELDQNAEIMKSVDAIHFIVTKADTFWDSANPTEDAAQLVREKYGHLLGPSRKLCLPGRYEMNVATNYMPRLYTFSLGKFYVGGVFDYNPEDSDKLIDVIMANSRSMRPASFLSKIKDKLTTPIF